MKPHCLRYAAQIASNPRNDQAGISEINIMGGRDMAKKVLINGFKAEPVISLRFMPKISVKKVSGINIKAKAVSCLAILVCFNTLYDSMMLI